MSSSCNKCVRVLRDLISGLQENNNLNSSYTADNGGGETGSPPLTLLKAIAGKTSPSLVSSQQQQQQQESQKLQVEEVEDGVRLTIPVETTMPNLLRRWTKLPQPVSGENKTEEEDDGVLQPLYHAMATSAIETEKGNGNKNSLPPSHIQSSSPSSAPLAVPLTIELKCRKCASSGPEGGARAFLMGPQPLSVILCHNRIASNKQEVEEILTHELVHLFDVQTLQLDLQDCENLAYSEVRAAKAAECRDSWNHFQPYCVKQKAISATNNLFPREGRNCINRVFQTAFADNRPFDDNTKKYYSPTSNLTGGSTSSVKTNTGSSSDV
jgi:Peptidase M76 family